MKVNLTLEIKSLNEQALDPEFVLDEVYDMCTSELRSIYDDRLDIGIPVSVDVINMYRPDVNDQITGISNIDDANVRDQRIGK